jgi:hypothetical protein
MGEGGHSDDWPLSTADSIAFLLRLRRVTPLATVTVVLPMVTTITEEHRNSGLPFEGFMTIAINSLEYQCWHEVGHATVCLHLGGDVEFIELIDNAARAHCLTTQPIRQSVACGGFAAEFYLLRAGYLPPVDEKEITQTIFRNTAKDREMFKGGKASDKSEGGKGDDEAFMNHAVRVVVPILKQYILRMKQVVRELLKDKKLDGNRLKEILAVDGCYPFSANNPLDISNG